MRSASLLLLFAACGGSGDGASSGSTPRKLVIAVYTTPREVLGERILPAFAEHWKSTRGEEITFETSYQASGAQARAVVGGLEADVVFLSLEPDVVKIEDAGLITHDWRAEGGGIVSSSIVVIGVRPGNPKGIRDWADLARPDVEVLTPNVRTSGGAIWNTVAVAAADGRRPGTDDEAAVQALAGVLGNVRVMDKGGRESMISFEKGVGDAIITYENEILVARRAGHDVDYVIPSSTVLIENPAAVVDVYADRHGVRDIAEAFVAFLREPEQQRTFSEYGLRPIGDGVTPAVEFPPTGQVYRIADLGGWKTVETWLLADGGLYDRAFAQRRAKP